MSELNRSVMKHYLDIPTILRISCCLDEPKTKKQIVETEGMGEPKVRGLLEWGRHLGVIRLQADGTYLATAFGRRVDKVRSQYLYELLYWNLVNGHRAIGLTVNHFLYNKSVSFSPEFSSVELRQFLIQKRPEIGYPTDRDLKSVYLESLSALHRPLKGFGTMGMVVSLPDGQTKMFRVNSHCPDWRSAAYILYSWWPPNISRMRISEVSSGYDSLGRIFFLAESQLMVLLAKLEQERAIALEIVADLNQIGLNPAMKAEDFLEMLIHD